MLLEAIKHIKLSQKDLEQLADQMSDWPAFQKAAPEMTYEGVLKAFIYETQYRKRIRKNIFDKLVGMYNRRMGDKNWAECNRFFADRSDSEAA